MFLGSNWQIEKSYTEHGISWTFSLKNTSHRWQAQSDWGDEPSIACRLILEYVESQLGAFDENDIRIDHVCGKNEDGHWYGEKRWVFLKNGANVWAGNEDRRTTMLRLLAEVLLVESRATAKV